jgi:purine-cytosine permease-like protein
MTDLSNFLVFTLYLLVPWTAINLTDFYLIRRGRYDIPELFKADGIYGRLLGARYRMSTSARRPPVLVPGPSDASSA